MATTAAGNALTQRHRTAQLAIRAGLLRDLIRLWRVVDPTNLSGTIATFVDAATVLIRARNRDSAGVAAAYFMALRFAELGAAGGLAGPRLADEIPAETIAGQVRGAGLAGIINARRAGQSPQAAASNGLVKVSGAATELVLAGGRQTVLRTLGADRRAAGWRRVTSGSSCDWCAGQAGETLRSDHFGQHDHCSCTAEPTW